MEDEDEEGGHDADQGSCVGYAGSAGLPDPGQVGRGANHVVRLVADQEQQLPGDKAHGGGHSSMIWYPTEANKELLIKSFHRAFYHRRTIGIIYSRHQWLEELNLLEERYAAAELIGPCCPRSVHSADDDIALPEPYLKNVKREHSHVE